MLTKLMSDKNISLKGPLPVCVNFWQLNPSQIMKNVFYFTLNLFLFIRYSNFCPDCFGHVRKTA